MIDMRSIQDLYPFASRWLDVGSGVRMHYVDEGEGEPIVFVHGNPTWSFLFRRLIGELRSRYRVIAPDHIGCGLSDKPGAGAYDYSLARRVDDLDRLIEHLGLGGDLTFGLHDWGGMIGAACALRRAAQIRRLIVFNTAAFLMPAGKRLPWRLRLIRNGGALAALLVQGLNGFCRGATSMACARPLPRAVRRAYLAPHDNWANRLATLRFVQDIPIHATDASYELAAWVDHNLHRLAEADVLICWGSRDFVFDDAYLGQWQRRFPRAVVYRFADAGHWVLEDAVDRIGPLVAGFLADHPVARPVGSLVELGR